MQKPEFHIFLLFFSLLLPTMTSSLFPRQTLIVSDRWQLNRKRSYMYRDTLPPNCLTVDDEAASDNWNTTKRTPARGLVDSKHKMQNFERSRGYMFQTHYLLIGVRAHPHTLLPSRLKLVSRSPLSLTISPLINYTPLSCVLST